jgi:hypothetical protein
MPFYVQWRLPGGPRKGQGPKCRNQAARGKRRQGERRGRNRYVACLSPTYPLTHRPAAHRSRARLLLLRPMASWCIRHSQRLLLVSESEPPRECGIRWSRCSFSVEPQTLHRAPGNAARRSLR